MVEKWLLQVEVLMLKSVRDVIRQGVHQYAEVCIQEASANLHDLHVTSTLGPGASGGHLLRSSPTRVCVSV